jgi:cytochrome b561
MTSQANGERYAATVIALHWLMALLIVGSYATMELREFYPKGSVPREALKSWHYTIGLSILALFMLRIVARIMSTTPPIVPPLSHWQKLAARTVHLALLALMIALPVLGWLILSAEGEPPVWFGLQLPALVGTDKELAETLEEIHETGANIGYALIAVHTAAALFHHYVVRDNALVRMLPGRSG